MNFAGEMRHKIESTNEESFIRSLLVYSKFMQNKVPDWASCV